jgi:hypothetical protein
MRHPGGHEDPVAWRQVEPFAVDLDDGGALEDHHPFVGVLQEVGAAFVVPAQDLLDDQGVMGQDLLSEFAVGWGGARREQGPALPAGWNRPSLEVVVLADHTGAPAPAAVVPRADAADEQDDQQDEKQQGQHGEDVPVATRTEPLAGGRRRVRYAGTTVGDRPFPSRGGSSPGVERPWSPSVTEYAVTTFVVCRQLDHPTKLACGA